MNYNSKIGEDEFSTNEIYHDSKSYSSRHQKIKNRTNSIDILPYKLQRAAVFIQRFWRTRMAVRRLFYQQVVEQLTDSNQITAFKNQKQREYLKSVENRNEFCEKLNELKVKEKVGKGENQSKDIIRKCIGIAFKLQKKMLTKEELSKLQKQRSTLKANIALLKKEKKDLRNYVTEEYQEEERMLMREIREASASLLKITTEKNNLRQKLMERRLLEY